MAGAALYTSIDGHRRLDWNFMTFVGKLEATVRSTLDVAFDRARAALWRIRGAAVAAKVRVGAGSRILRPWCLSIGQRSQLEHNVFIKITDDKAQLAMGEYVFIGCGSEFDVASKVSIGSNVLIAPGCFITDHSHAHRAGASKAAFNWDLIDVLAPFGGIRVEDNVVVTNSGHRNLTREVLPNEPLSVTCHPRFILVVAIPLARVSETKHPRRSQRRDSDR